MAESLSARESIIQLHYSIIIHVVALTLFNNSTIKHQLGEAFCSVLSE